MKFLKKLFKFDVTPSIIPFSFIKMMFVLIRRISGGELKILQRGTRENFLYNGSFHEAIGPILAFAQVFFQSF